MAVLMSFISVASTQETYSLVLPVHLKVVTLMPDREVPMENGLRGCALPKRPVYPSLVDNTEKIMDFLKMKTKQI